MTWARKVPTTVRRWYQTHAGARRATTFALGAIFAAFAAKLVPACTDAVWAMVWPEEGTYRVSVQRNPDRIQVVPNADESDEDGQATSAGGTYLVEGPIDQIGPPPDDADKCVGRFEWAQQYDAVLADMAQVRVRVDATTDEPVNVTGIDIIVDERNPPLDGVHLACPGRGDVIEDRVVSADLSNQPPTVTVSNGGEAPSQDVNYVVRRGEPEAFLVIVTTPTCDCLWHIELHVEVDGDERVEVIDDEGKPFRTTASTAATSYRWRNGSWTPLSPVGSPVPPTPTGDCPYLSMNDVDTITGLSWTLSDVRTESGSVDQPTQSTTCTFLLADRSVEPPPYIQVAVMTAATQSRANTDFDELVTGYRTYETASPIQGIGNQAYLFDDALVAQHGLDTLHVTADGVDQPRDVVQGLAHQTATNTWGTA